MNRREFVRWSGLGMMSLLLSGCGILGTSAGVAGEEVQKNSVSGGNKMKIVVINSSPHARDESTSIYLSDRFSAGAVSAGHQVFTFDGANEETHPCRGCDICHMNGPCVFSDAIENKLMPELLSADMIVLVTPLYYYGMSAQLKTVIDRFYSRTGMLHGKKSMLIATAYDSADWTMTALSEHYATLVRYMDWVDVGQVLGIGCGSRALVEKSSFGEQAYNIGANL